MVFCPRNFFTILFFSLAFVPLSAQKTDTISNRKFVVNDILVDGDKKTKASIIKRELNFKKGDTIRASDWQIMAQRSKENLMNTSLFNFVTIDTVHLSTGQTDVTISVVERWYIWPVPIFQVEERNFNVWWDQDHRSLAKTDYGFYINDNNTLGLRQVLNLKVQLGYTQQFGIGYNIPYITKRQTSGLQFSLTQSLNHTVAYTSVGGIVTFLNTTDNHLQEQYTSALDYTYRQGLYNTFYGEVNFHSCNVQDTILKLTTDYLPGNKTSALFFGLSLSMRRDLRDNRAYPLNGYFFDFGVRDYGLNLFNNPFNILYAQGSFHCYFPMSKKFFYSVEVEGKVSADGAQPYYLQRGMGYSNDYVRGYEAYVIDGNDYCAFKNEVKLKVLNVTVQNLPLFGITQFSKAYYAFYLTAFSDWGYVGSPDPYVTNNFLANSPMWGNGFGLDLVTYYDLVWRLEYSWNRMGQGGVYLHFEADM